MTKQDILNTTGLSEEEFYQRYPDQETFCSDYPEMCPDMMDDEDLSDKYVFESDYDDSLYEAEDGVETTAPYTDYNQYKNAMQTYGAESNKAATYNSFQNDLYNQSGKTRGSSETASQLGDMFNTLSPEQQDALAQKYGAQFITNTPSANRRNYVNSMEMTVPGKGTGYYSFPTNDVVYGNKDLERPNYELSAMKMAPYKMPAAPKKFSIEPTQLINSISAGYKNPAVLNLNNGNLPIPKYSLNSTMEKVGATNQPFVTSTPSYSSIIDLLKARKLDSSFANRKKLAEEAGIKNYTGSANQNMDLINRMDNFNPYSTEMELGGENMFVNGGGIPMHGFGGPTRATASDSLAVMNSQIALNKFYENEVKQGRLKKDKKGSSVDENYLKRSLKTLNDENLKFYRDQIAYREKWKHGLADTPYEFHFDLSPSDVSKLEYQGLGKTKSGDANKQYYRDLITPMQNLVAPFALVDSRIKPRAEIRYTEVGNYPGGNVRVYDYDPIAVKPAAMKTAADWAYMKKTYGINPKPTTTKTVNTTKDKVTTSVRPKYNLERMEMTPMRPLDIPISVPHGELLPIRPKQTVNLGNLTGTHPIEIYDRRGNFLRTEYTGDADGVVDHNYSGKRHYAHWGIGSYLDLNAPIKEVEKRSNGGLVKYQKKGEVKQNPPKEFTDFKKFQRAERLYKDSLDTYNNYPAFNKNMSALYNNMMPNVTTEENFVKVYNEFVDKYIKSAKKNKINLNIVKEQDLEDKKYKTITTTDANGKVHTEWMSAMRTVKPKQPVVFKPAPVRSKDNLERMEIIPYTFNNPIGAPHGELIPITPMKLKQRGYKPFYGPGNTLIGFTDDDRQFYPGEYTGAPHNQINLQDKYLLDHPELLKEYLKKRDNYKVDNFELGGVNIHPAMRTNFKQGGYYGMDGRLHRAKGSGTYVMNGGYYFNVGGATDEPPIASPATVPGAMGMGDPIAVPQSSLVYNNKPNPDGTFNVNNDYDYYGGYNEDDAEDYGGFQTQNERALKRQARRQERRNTQYETPDLSGLDSAYEQQNEQPIIQSYDPSEYFSAIDPATGFTKWSKGNQQLTNIKKQDPALWQQLKNEGKGARFRTGQTDVQKVGRAAGRLANNLEMGVNIANAAGQLLNNKFQQRSLNNAAINKGSTASMYTNPQGAGKGDYGQTGSGYGMMDPTSVGSRSFKGMYGKYGMEVPTYDVGGLVPQFATLSDVGLESLSPNTFSVNSSADYLPVITPDFTNFTTSPKPIIESTGVYRDNRAVNQMADNNTVTTLDPDFALQAVAGIESGSKPGQSKVGMPTKLVGEGGKKASASGTFQITEQTLHEIFNKDKSISSKYKNFNTFKNAFDTDSKVEYEAAKSLMTTHIKNYGIYALGAWYYPEFARKAAAGDKSVFDIVPRRDFGNNVKWGDDFKLKLDAYNKAAGTNYTPNTIFNAPKPVAQKKYTTPPGENPMARKTFRDFQTEFSGITNMGIWGDARHREKKSDHNTADALDIGIKNIDQGNQVVQKLIKEAKDRNIKYIIFNSRIWDAKSNTWSAYYGDNPHKTHVHTSFYRVKKQLGGQVMEMDEDEIKQFLKAGGQLEFLD